MECLDVFGVYIPEKQCLFGHTAFYNCFFVITGFAQIWAYTISSLGSIGYHIRVFQRSIRTRMLEYGYGVFSITY